MEEKNDSRENLEKGKNNKTLIIVLVVLGIILLIGIVFCIINRNADSNKNNNDNNKDNDVVDKDNDDNYMAVKVNDIITFSMRNKSDEEFTKISEYKCTDDKCSLGVGIQGLTIYDNTNGIYGIDDNKKLILYNVGKGVVGTYSINGTSMYEDGKVKYLYIKSIDNEKYGIVDLNGNVIKDFNLDYYNKYYPFLTNWYSIKDDAVIDYKNGKYGIIKITSNDVLADYSYDEIKIDDSYYFEARINNEWNLYVIKSNELLSKLTTKKYDISNDNLYVSEQEKKYSNYERSLSVKTTKNFEYYIENDKLFLKNNGVISELNLENETPKYLAIGADCGGVYVQCLTKEGNVFLLSKYIEELDIKKVYDKNDAEEFLLFSESEITDTCGSLSAYVVTNDNKMLSFGFETYDTYKSREEVHPFSLVFRTKETKTSNGVVLYPDGTINKFMYPFNSTAGKDVYNNVNQEFVKVDDKDLLVSYIFEANEKVYIIDTDGIIYEVTNINDDSDARTLIKLEKSNVISEKIKYVEVLSYVRNIEYRYKNIEVTDKVNQITLYGENGTKVEMIK